MIALLLLAACIVGGIAFIAKCLETVNRRNFLESVVYIMLVLFFMYVATEVYATYTSCIQFINY